jgi:hypothetical protein
MSNAKLPHVIIYLGLSEHMVPVNLLFNFPYYLWSFGRYTPFLDRAIYPQLSVIAH